MPSGTLTARSSRRRLLVWVVLVVLIALYLRVFEHNPAVAQTPEVTSWRVETDPGVDPSADVWRHIPGVEVPLSGQTLTYPQGGLDVSGTGARTVTVRSVHTDVALYVSVRWRDATNNDGTGATEEFADSVAVQWPADPRVSVPAVCMGQADKAVNIWQWRADSQAGPPTELVAPDGYVDGYPSTDEEFYPARAAGNPYARANPTPVQNLVAGGFGTLAPVAEQTVQGRGVHENFIWTTVFRRDLASPGDLQPAFREPLSTDVAFAVWDGARGDRDGMKSVTAFVKLRISDEVAPSGPGPWPFIGVTAFAIGVLILVFFMVRRRAGPERNAQHAVERSEGGT